MSYLYTCTNRRIQNSMKKERLLGGKGRIEELLLINSFCWLMRYFIIQTFFTKLLAAFHRWKTLLLSDYLYI